MRIIVNIYPSIMCLIIERESNFVQRFYLLTPGLCPLKRRKYILDLFDVY